MGNSQGLSMFRPKSATMTSWRSYRRPRPIQRHGTPHMGLRSPMQWGGRRRSGTHKTTAPFFSVLPIRPVLPSCPLSVLCASIPSRLKSGGKEDSSRQCFIRGSVLVNGAKTRCPCSVGFGEEVIMVQLPRYTSSCGCIPSRHFDTWTPPEPQHT